MPVGEAAAVPAPEMAPLPPGTGLSGGESRAVALELYELYEVETGPYIDVYGFLAFCELLDPSLSPARARVLFVEGAGATEGKVGAEAFVEWMTRNHSSFLASWATAGL